MEPAPTESLGTRLDRHETMSPFDFVVVDVALFGSWITISSFTEIHRIQWLCVRIYSGCCTLNKLDASTNGNHAIYRNPWALSSALATLGTLQPRALGFLIRQTLPSYVHLASTWHHLCYEWEEAVQFSSIFYILSTSEYNCDWKCQMI